MTTRTQIASGAPTVPDTLWRCGGRQCGVGECEHEENELHRHAFGPAPQVVPGIVHDVLSSSGSPLPEDVRHDMERRLGHDFAAVRIHTDARAAHAAGAVRANAFTVGQRVAFGRGQFDPMSSTGRELLAHELVHTIQQRHQSRPASGSPLTISDPGSAAEREAASIAGAAIAEGGTLDPHPVVAPSMISRQPAGASTSTLSDGDERLNDPGFLICTAFCYLGVPPSSFKDLVQGMLECISAEMRAAGISNYDEQFRAARAELAAYSKVRLLAKIFRFLLHGELGLLRGARITAASAPIRERILARLLAAGASRAGLVAAEAVVRKVVLAIDAAIVAGCATYCGALQIGQRVVELTEAVAQGIAGAMEAMGGIRDAFADAIAEVILSMYGQLNPANWVLSPSLPARTRTDLAVIGAVLWSQIRVGNPWRSRRPGQTEADLLLANASRTLAAYNVPGELVEAVAAALQQSLAQQGSRARVTAGQLLRMSPAGLVAFLRDNDLLTFGTDPVDFANAELAAALEPATP